MWSELPEACDNTLLIAERCHVEFIDGANLMPAFPVPEGESEESWLVKEVEVGLHSRFGDVIPDNVRTQAEYEVGVICQMGFPGYFLVTADLVRYAKESGIRVGPGRGSAAGAMIAYAWASPSSTRSSTACCSSGSSTPSASRCPISTWTSTSVVAPT